MQDDRFWDDITSHVAMLASDGRITSADAGVLYVAIANRQKRAADIKTLDDWADRQAEWAEWSYSRRGIRGVVLESCYGGRRLFALRVYGSMSEARAKAAAWVRTLEASPARPPSTRLRSAGRG